jgi:subtilisin family serine protease
MVLNEKGSKTEINKIKNKIAKEYKIYNIFEGMNFLTFESSEEITKVKNKIEKYGEIEELLGKKINLTENNWNLEKIDQYYAKNELNLTGKGIRVAVIDTGVDMENNELSEKISKNFDCYDTKYKELDDLELGPEVYKEECLEVNTNELIFNEHGTHVAGIIASESFGVAPGVEIVDFNILDRNKPVNSGLTSPRAQMSSYEHIFKLLVDGYRIDIINMSYGGNFSILERDILKTIKEKGVLLVSASGNPCEYSSDNGKTCEKPSENNNFAKDPYNNILFYPADYDFVTSVGSIDQDKKRSRWLDSDGNYSTSNSSYKLNIVAPGTKILSTVLRNESDTKNGTSMASPHIAGILALYIENYPTFDSIEIENMLYEGAEDLVPDEEPENQGWDRTYGYGLATAIPPKHYKINKKIILNGEFKLYSFASDKAKDPDKLTLDGEYHASRATGWNEEKERFDYYRISVPTTGKELGWIKADDTFNNEEQDRETLNFTEPHLILYNSADLNDFDKTIEINPKRIRTHVSEDKITDPITGKTEWFKINLPEYSVENKWIYIPEGTNSIIDKDYNEINFESILYPKYPYYLTFYDDPKLLSNPTKIDYTSEKNAIVTEGYQWIETKIGYRWYKISIPELNIYNKWVEIGDREWGNIHFYGLMDKISGKSVIEKDAHYIDNLKRNLNAYTPILKDGYVSYRFDSPLLVKQVYIKNNSSIPFASLKLELLNKNEQVVYTKMINENELTQNHFYLNIPVPNVYSYRLTNKSPDYITLNHFDIFGTYEESAVPSKKINFESILYRDEYLFYDEPNLKANSVKVSGTYGKKATATEGYYWVEEKTGYSWYKVTIPELNITNKWVYMGVGSEWGRIHTHGLMDKAPYKSLEQHSISYFDNLEKNQDSYTDIGAGGHLLYEFENPVSVEQMLIEKYYKNEETVPKLVIELLDENKIVLDRYTFDSVDDFYKTHFNLNSTVENVYYYKITNLGDKYLRLKSFDLF